MSDKKVIYLKDYIKKDKGALQNKIVVGSDIRPGQAVELAIDHSPVQIVTNGFDELRVMRIKDDVDQFLNKPASYLIDVTDENSTSFEYEFYAQSKKAAFLSEVESHLKSSKMRKIRDDIYLIADELFTNFEKSALDKKTKMTFGISTNDETCVVYCRDSFGTLKPSDMLENMQRCFQKGVMAAIKPEEGKGAGIGSYLIYTLGVGMAITVDPGKASLVSIWMPKNIHHEDRLELNKCLLIIEKKES